MNALPIIKLAANTVVGIGTSKVVHTIIKNNVQPETAQDTVAVASATFVISGMAVQATKEYTGAMIDDAAEAVTTVRNLFKNKETESETEEV